MQTADSTPLKATLAQLDARIKRVDEPRWLSSRYATSTRRDALITLYAYYYELARIRLAVTDQTMGQIRYQWWRDGLELIVAGTPREHDVSVALAAQFNANALDLDGLRGLLDASEAAYLASDRGAEPEVKLAQIASRLLDPTHIWNPALEPVIAQWSALRRHDTSGVGPDLVRCDEAVRPALAHLRLRRIWGVISDHQKLSGIRDRLCILRSVLTGYC